MATARQNVIVSETNLQLQQLYTINALSRNIGASQVRFAPIVPTDTMVIPLTEAIEATQDLISEAVAKNPTLAQARIDLKNRQLNAKAAANGLLPTLDLVGFYGASSLAGTFNSALCASPASRAIRCALRRYPVQPATARRSPTCSTAARRTKAWP